MPGLKCFIQFVAFDFQRPRHPRCLVLNMRTVSRLGAVLILCLMSQVSTEVFTVLRSALHTMMSNLTKWFSINWDIWRSQVLAVSLSQPLACGRDHGSGSRAWEGVSLGAWYI